MCSACSCVWRLSCVVDNCNVVAIMRVRFSWVSVKRGSTVCIKTSLMWRIQCIMVWKLSTHTVCRQPIQHPFYICASYQVYIITESCLSCMCSKKLVISILFIFPIYLLALHILCEHLDKVSPGFSTINFVF